jgi:hypothetical protein
MVSERVSRRACFDVSVLLVAASAAVRSLVRVPVGDLS